MRTFLQMAATQLADDARALPARTRARFTDEGRAARCATIEELRCAARRAAPRAVFDFVDGGAADETTLRANRSAFESLHLRQRILRDVSTVDTSTTLFGRRLAVPLVVSPTGGSALNRYEGEQALARAAGARGVGYALSVMSSWPLEAVAAAADGPKWFQLYVWRDRALSEALLDRAIAAGYDALVLTVDTPVVGVRERDGRNGFSIPPRITARSFGEALLRPRWAMSFLRGAPLNGHVAAGSGSGDAKSLAAYTGTLFDPTVTWKDLAWVRSRWKGPLLLKGVIDPEDALLAVDAGVDGVIVSNHGGRQLDHAPSSIDALSPVVEAVGGSVPVLLDGGIRRGSDILKALALGASACMTGRPLLYGLAAAGQAGADRALEILTNELRLAMSLTGRVGIDQVDASLLGATTGPAPYPVP